jgi:hypothetical protein
LPGLRANDGRGNLRVPAAILKEIPMIVVMPHTPPELRQSGSWLPADLVREAARHVLDEMNATVAERREAEIARLMRGWLFRRTREQAEAEIKTDPWLWPHIIAPGFRARGIVEDLLNSARLADASGSKWVYVAAGDSHLIKAEFLDLAKERGLGNADDDA